MADGGPGDDRVRIEAGPGTDTITYGASDGQDNVYIDGSSGVDTLTINAGLQSFTVYDRKGNVLYKAGDGSSVIKVISIEQGRILDPDGNILYQWP
jgi:hypothetical protein